MDVFVDTDTCTNCGGAEFIRDWEHPAPDGETELALCPECNRLTTLIGTPA